MNTSSVTTLPSEKLKKIPFLFVLPSYKLCPSSSSCSLKCKEVSENLPSSASQLRRRLEVSPSWKPQLSQLLSYLVNELFNLWVSQFLIDWTLIMLFTPVWEFPRTRIKNESEVGRGWSRGTTQHPHKSVGWHACMSVFCGLTCRSGF
jgi:hypothetical protein